MNFEILHNGKNIRDSIEVVNCYSSDRYGGKLDDLTITFVSGSNTIEFNKDDKLEIKTIGGFSTGTMYLDSCIGENGRFAVRATSCKQESKRRKSKIWNHVRLTRIIGDVAGNVGLIPVTYGIEDYSYISIAQIMETDLQLLARVCKREGYSIKCDSGKLIVFNEYYLENNSAPIAISKDDVDVGYSFSRSVNGLSSMTVTHFDINTLKNISFTSRDGDIPGGEDIRVEYLKDINEAQRFSKGYLRDANKYHITGALQMPYNGSISAGTVADLSGFEEFDGRYVIYEAMHDFVREKTVIKVRKVLGYLKAVTI